MTAPTHADLLARIAELRAQDEARTPGVWEAWSGASAGGGEYITATESADQYTFGISPGHIGEAGFDKARRDAAAIVTAVNLLGPMLDACEGVLDRHKPQRVTVTGGAKPDVALTFCKGCSERWPCPEAAAVLRALGIEEGA